MKQFPKVVYLRPFGDKGEEWFLVEESIEQDELNGKTVGIYELKRVAMVRVKVTTTAKLVRPPKKRSKR